ncbi:hypothetical protein AN618_04880 [Fervidicola ferrireducens]|uniref:Agmatinase n=1 Tax=Fervidicola ferrireducens TaxID=520764 RepID=A0A140LCZ6_9FIRM|nr:arginase family protein [Fervidicola ferrireducens]KXG78421.1 hypothetical protein AN618_04880 [Fervidicola ferrireducens]
MTSPAVNILKSDESVAFQKKLLGRANAVIDLAGVTGFRFCSEKRQLAELKKKFKVSSRGITFLGPGDFHHLSIYFLERTGPVPVLILFDHHSDMQSSPAGFVTCGSWARQILIEGKVGKCLVVGVSSMEEDLFKDFSGGKVAIFPEDLPHEKKVSGILMELERIKGPVYISIDKDVLSEKDAATNWDQGVMSLEELLDLIEVIGEAVPIVGADVCGEWRISCDLVFLSGEDIKKASLNEKANIKILEKLLEVWQKDKKNSKISLYKSEVRG